MGWPAAVTTFSVAAVTILQLIDSIGEPAGCVDGRPAF